MGIKRYVTATIVLLTAAPVLAQSQTVMEHAPGRSTYIRGGAFADQAHYGSNWNVGNNGADLNQAYKAYIRPTCLSSFPSPRSRCWSRCSCSDGHAKAAFGLG